MSQPEDSSSVVLPESAHAPDTQSVLAAIIESSDDAIYSKDSNGRVTSWNGAAERLYGYRQDEVLGRDISLIIPPERQGEERVILGAILRGEKVDHYETTRLCKDGTRAEVSLTVSPVTDIEGVVVGASVIARDISDRRRQEALERELEKRDFLARAAHELKSPLTAISGFAQILSAEAESLGPEDKERVYTALIRQSERANHLIRDLLDLARLESGQVEIELVSVPLREIVAASVESASLDPGVLDNRVDASARVLADPFRLEQVFANLFSNSIKYGASRIRVDVALDGGRVSVSIGDDGPGVPDEIVPELFVPFTRGASEEAPGSGLGLSIVKRLCEAFGGDITYDPEGAGATFVVTLLAA